MNQILVTCPAHPDLKDTLASTILSAEAVSKLVEAATCPLVSAQYLALVNRLGRCGAEEGCLDMMEQCLADKVFSSSGPEEKARSRDVWQPLFLKVFHGEFILNRNVPAPLPRCERFPL